MYAQKYRIFRLFGNLKAFFNVAAFGVPDAVVIQVADEIVVAPCHYDIIAEGI